MKVFIAIENLILYAIKNNLIQEEDVIFTKNKIYEILKIEDLKDAEPTGNVDLENILKDILDYALENGLINDSVTERDLFDTKIMGTLIDRPSNIRKTFFEKYEKSPKEATDYYYKLSQDSDYIRRYRIEKDVKWQVETEYGILDISINLSKPEKDTKDILLAKNTKSTDYPKCPLCKENEGYMGRLNHPARQNHRIMPVKITGSNWFFQYSPYVYYNEHCIVFSGEHIPMKIERDTFAKLLDFIKIFPHYFVGSNADLPITGGSILSHDHFQGGNYTFCMEKAPIEKEFKIDGFEDVKVGIVKWPMSVIRLSSDDTDRIIDLADKILESWRNYTDEECFIFSHTNGEVHNTITPIARKIGDKFELDLVLRNNITTDEHPFGVYHPHEELHNIKKENIGLIEVMGLAILPPRLKSEMEIVKQYILENRNIEENEKIQKHSHWVKSFINNYNEITKDNIDDIIRQEIGKTFLTVLEHAGVFKRDEKGKKGFEKFINNLNK
ncbi:UDP-glucose--hexose-1-phosphate uridylyltransferase [uncultured Tyzzerella sp.]|uniref:UDP-glucose--hexose-1-phosphate uridylyltransferase n=1 Tax=uncultured Tyzzerella sp. TaxID=2321398 RepID=UPI0029426974|nr:UDP-glucose--hexose-1-phosphate uridylyltransferase [uncultured Tyzzerella sp.]